MRLPSFSVIAKSLLCFASLAVGIAGAPDVQVHRPCEPQTSELCLTKDFYYDASRDLPRILDTVANYHGPRTFKHMDMFSGAGNYCKHCRENGEPAFSFELQDSPIEDKGSKGNPCSHMLEIP